MLREQDDLKAAGQFLTEGKVILCPTDTIWKICCNALDQNAVNKLIQIKGGLEHKQFALLVRSIEHLKSYIVNIHPRIETLLCFYERPLTILYDNPRKTIEHLKNKHGKVAIQISQDEDLNLLMDATGFPLLSTGAHLLHHSHPSGYHHISSEILNSVDYIFQDRKISSERQIPSLLVSYNEEGELIFLR